MNDSMLRQELQTISENNYEIPDDVDAYPYAQWLLTNIGSPDPELRDKLIYRTLDRWITRGVFRPKELRGLLLQAFAQMNDGIGEKDTDSVFKRAFSILVIPLVLTMHAKDPFLSDEQLHSVADEVFHYIKSEEDVRGYVEGKGWAHAIAHAADALHAIARVLPSVDYGMAMLTVIREKVSISYHMYINFEDERMVSAVMALKNQHLLSQEEWEQWLFSFTTFDKLPIPQNDILVQNIRQFLCSLYFRELEHDDQEYLRTSIRKILIDIKKYAER